MTDLGCGPLERVDSPPPLRPIFGLLQTAEAVVDGVRFVAEATDYWMNGIEVWPQVSYAGASWNEFESSTSVAEKSTGDIVENPQFGAFVAYEADSCPVWTVPDQNAYKQRIETKLAAVESAIVAKELLTPGVTPTTPYLSDSNCQFPGGTAALSLTRGVAALEKYIGETNTAGVIHMSPQAVDMLGALGHILVFFPTTPAKTVIRTFAGTIIIPDAGYAAGATPAGQSAASASQEWIYASGPIDIRRTEMFVLPEELSQALNRGGLGASVGTTQTVTYRAERYYVLSWDNGIQAAALVNYPT